MTRSGQELGIPRVTSVVGDVTEAARVRALTAGASTVYFAAQPAYTDWPDGFPPLVEGLLDGLRGSGARLAVADNLYAYGDTHGQPLHEDLPLDATTRKGAVRARAAQRLLAAHAAGDVAVTMVRGSDYFGPDGFDSLLGDRFFGPILAGRKVRLLGDPDAPHTVTFIADFARTLIELSGREEAYGRAWHVPSAPAVSFRRLAELAAEVSGSPPVLVSSVSRTGLRLVGMFSPPVREMIEMLYEFEQPFIMDDSRVRQAFGLTETPLEHALRLTAEWWRGEIAAAAVASGKQPR